MKFIQMHQGCSFRTQLSQCFHFEELQLMPKKRDTEYD